MFTISVSGDNIPVSLKIVTKIYNEYLLIGKSSLALVLDVAKDFVWSGVNKLSFSIGFAQFLKLNASSNSFFNNSSSYLMNFKSN